MKKTIAMVSCLMVMLLLSTAAAGALQLDGGPNSNQPVLIGTEQYATEISFNFGWSLESVEHWYIVRAPQAGDYTIRMYRASGYSMINAQLFNGQGQSITDSVSLTGSATTHTVHIDQADSIIYIGFLVSMPTNGEVCFSVCFDGYHLANGERYRESEPTCTEPGRYVRRCTLCGAVGEEEEIPATGHTAGEWQVGYDATCVENGQMVQPCVTCGEVLNANPIEATGHQPGEMEVTLEATCKEQGVRSRLCTVCGEVLETESIPLGEHTPGDMVTAIEANCTQDGKREQRCMTCGALLEEEVITAIGHRSGMWETLREATCTTDGTRVQRCSVCGETLNTETVPAYGHSAGEWAQTKAAGVSDGERVKRCTACGEVLECEAIPATGEENAAPEGEAAAAGEGEEYAAKRRLPEDAVEQYGPFFETPEACMQYFAAGLKEGDVERMLSAYDTKLRADYYDRKGAWMSIGVVPYNDSRLDDAPLQYIKFKYADAAVVENMILTLLLPEDSAAQDYLTSGVSVAVRTGDDGEGRLRFSSEAPEMSIDDYLACVELSRLSQVELDYVFAIRHDLLSNHEAVRRSYENMFDRYTCGIDDCSAVLALFEFEGRLYCTEFQMFHYEHGWKIDSQNSRWTGFYNYGGYMGDKSEFELSSSLVELGYPCDILYDRLEPANETAAIRSALPGVWTGTQTGDETDFFETCTYTLRLSDDGTAVISGVFSVAEGSPYDGPVEQTNEGAVWMLAGNTLVVYNEDEYYSEELRVEGGADMVLYSDSIDVTFYRSTGESPV